MTLMHDIPYGIYAYNYKKVIGNITEIGKYQT